MMTKEEEVMNLRSGGTHKELEGEGNGVNTVLMYEILNKLKKMGLLTSVTKTNTIPHRHSQKLILMPAIPQRYTRDLPPRCQVDN